jgi:Recombinase
MTKDEALRSALAQLDGYSSRAIAAELNARGIPAPNGGQWLSQQVLRIQRLRGVDTSRRPKVTRPYPKSVAAHDYAETLRPLLESKSLARLSANAIADELNKRGIKTHKGGKWSTSLVIRVQIRLGPDMRRLTRRADLPPLTRAWWAKD